MKKSPVRKHSKPRGASTDRTYDEELGVESRGIPVQDRFDSVFAFLLVRIRVVTVQASTTVAARLRRVEALTVPAGARVAENAVRNGGVYTTEDSRSRTA